MSNSSNLLSIVASTAIGVGLGLLFAPKKGSETRQDIANRANKLKDNLTNEAQNLSTKAKKTYTKSKTEFDTKLNDVVNKSSYKAEGIIESFENQLDNLKTKNKNLRKDGLLKKTKTNSVIVKS